MCWQRKRDASEGNKGVEIDKCLNEMRLNGRNQVWVRRVGDVVME